jgi:hypothetical protein
MQNPIIKEEYTRRSREFPELAAAARKIQARRLAAQNNKKT